MTSPASSRPDLEVRPGFSRWVSIALAAVCLLCAVWVPASSGFSRGWDAASWLLALGVLALWLYAYPSVRVRADDVVLVNPLQTITVPYNALIDVSTKFHLTLVTPAGRYGAWAAPAPGAASALRAARKSDRDLVKEHGGDPLRDRLVRVGDQLDSVSGRAAHEVRERLARAVEEGRIDPDLTEGTKVVRRVNWVHPLLLLVLVVLGLLLR